MPESYAQIQVALLDWFRLNARDLPWRRTRNPYHVLVSEIMLQQTQVDRVIPKYHAFLAAFPTVESLAEASTAEVIRMWAGLGYNRRAVNLQRTAKVVVEEYAGEFPRDVAALLKLPGIGPYTAGAVACFAFEQDVAFIDTNIRRVLRRALLGPDEQVSDVSERELIALGTKLVPQGQGWQWNQAIMELGALICTAANPACLRCPINTQCRAYAMRRAADEAIVLAMGDSSNLPYANIRPPRQVRRVAERRETPFQGSRRYYRGRIIEVLRGLPSDTALSLGELGPQIKPDYQPADEPWLRDLALGLARDGLAIFNQDTLHLPH